MRLPFGFLAAILILSGYGTLWAQAAKALDGIGPQAVFKPPSREAEIGVFQKIQACGAARAGATDSKFVACVVAVLEQAGASPEATAVAALLEGEGYLDSFRKMGKVDLASAAYPIRANDNGEYLLVNGTPRVVRVGDPDNWKRIDIRKDPLYPALVRKYPRLELWGAADFKAMQRLAGGGQRFVFSYVLLNGCHACEVGGYARVAFDFSSAGVFSGTKLLRLSKTR
ncbi:MAG TPA: hypothetical protein VJA16_23090 [Thermoanaerobaculia bacterium]